ncbi:hypothetical protein OBBRIDRAFT_840293 [Obba rivulosa]|uniref:DEAD/DEAH-box helicase domain-containing protein n=1 Tax=Obba rivulosa TaxID=1052685 RepID=A0A8E2AFU2_9APHY|nr:hypothetical protein OBBRIDRAFT_840293 [Obba rivulosa]
MSTIHAQGHHPCSGPPSVLRATIRAQGFPAPTPIQCHAWPMALSGRDVVAIAQTGSGKIIPFALPAMLHINAQPLLAPASRRWSHRAHPRPNP